MLLTSKLHYSKPPDNSMLDVTRYNTTKYQTIQMLFELKSRNLD